MTMIRIDPAEMDSACTALANEAEQIGQTITGLRAQCACSGLPVAVADQLATTLTTLERTLKEIQLELLLEALILTMRAMMAIRAGEAVAGQLHPVVTAPVGFVGASSPSTGPVFAPTVWASRPAAPSSGPMAGGAMNAFFPQRGLGDIPTVKDPFTAPEPNDFKSWSNSMTIDTNKNGIPNGMDNNFRGTSAENYKPKPSQIDKPKP
jgi:hypothetical protein